MVTSLVRIVLQQPIDPRTVLHQPVDPRIVPRTIPRIVPRFDPTTVDFLVLQQTVDPAAGTPIQYVGTFLLAVLFYAITGHVAARYVLGDTPFKLALGVGAAPALASILLQQYGFLVVAPAALALDFVAYHVLYRVKYRTAGICAIMHFTISVIVGVALSAILLVVLG